MNECSVIRDLIPLYVEELISDEGKAMVEQHLVECPECKGYFEMIRQDYQKHVGEKPDKHQLDDAIKKLARYQRNIKLAAILTAMLMSCIVVGARVQFLSTIPFLVLTPFICSLFYRRSLPIFISSIPFGIIAAMLSQENSSFIPFFTVFVLITTGIGVGAGGLIKYGLKQYHIRAKITGVVLAVALLGFGSLIHFGFWGNPIGYIEALIKTNAYVNKTYEKGTLRFKGVNYNFKDNNHYGRFEYILNGTRQEASIGFYRNGVVSDYYKSTLEMQFCDERSQDLKANITAAIDYNPMSIYAKPESELNITQDELNDRYYHLSYDLEKRDKAAALRKSESEKLGYVIFLGDLIGEYESYSKEAFMEKSIVIMNALKVRNVPYNNIEIKAEDSKSNLHRVYFNKNSSEQELINSYEYMDMMQEKKR